MGTPTSSERLRGGAQSSVCTGSAASDPEVPSEVVPVKISRTWNARPAVEQAGLRPRYESWWEQFPLEGQDEGQSHPLRLTSREVASPEQVRLWKRRGKQSLRVGSVRIRPVSCLVLVPFPL